MKPRPNSAKQECSTEPMEDKEIVKAPMLMMSGKSGWKREQEIRYLFPIFAT